MLRNCALNFSTNWNECILLIEFSYNNSIDMAPYEALYSRKFQLPLYWDEVGKKAIMGLEIIQTSIQKVSINKGCLKEAQDRQKVW